MRGKKLVKHFTLKPQIFSDKPETSQQEEKEKEKKERKIGGKILTYLVLNFSLWKGWKKTKKKPKPRSQQESGF